MSLKGGAQRERPTQHGGRNSRDSHQYEDFDNDNPYERRDNSPRHDRRNDRFYDNDSNDSYGSDRRHSNHQRRSDPYGNQRSPSDRPRSNSRPRHQDGQNDHRYSPSDTYHDRPYSPGNRNYRNPLPDKGDNQRQSSSVPDDGYCDPWDNPTPTGTGPQSLNRQPPLKNTDANELVLEFPDSDDDGVNSKNSGKKKKKDKDRDKYKVENGLTTVDLGPGIYKPMSHERPPPHHSRSKDNTPFPSQSSKLNKEPPLDGDDDKDKIVYGEDENEERGNWSGRFDFILSMLGYAVGLGNIWRFPYLCYRNGGGAFLFPFLLMMVIIGLPLFYLEAALGQFSSCGAMTCWNFAPLFKGTGVAMVLVSAMTGIYYNMILGWSLHYMFSSFTSELPFSTCTNHWNSKDCKLKLPVTTCDSEGEVVSDEGLCRDEDGNEIGVWNKTLLKVVTGRVLQSPSQEYWERSVLNFSNGIENFGQPKWDLVLCLLLAWIICFFCLMKGIKTTGKVVYFTAIFPYVVLVILFFRGVTLENASEGIKFFITPDFERLSDANVWKDAANQIFFSMSIAGGGLITLSSYNRFHNNILRDSLIVALGDSFTCVLGGFVIFSYLGYMAGQLEVGIEDVAKDGAGLAFVVYPEAVSNLPPATLWALLFFFMLLTLGLDSQFAMIETVLTGVLDQCPKYRPKKTLVILIICIILFILGLPLTCPGGMYLLQLMDNYVGGMTLIILGFVELVALIFVYGVKRFCQDIHLMTGSTQFIFWKVTWMVLSPLTIVFIFVFMLIDYKASTYDDYTYPAWADVLGWMFALASLIAIPIVMLFKINKETEGKNAWQKIKLLCLPTMYWGPALKKHRVLVDYVDGFQVDPFKDLQPRTTFVNYGFQSNGDSGAKWESQASLSRTSMVSSLSRGTAGTLKSGASFETNV